MALDGYKIRWVIHPFLCNAFPPKKSSVIFFEKVSSATKRKGDQIAECLYHQVSFWGFLETSALQLFLSFALGRRRVNAPVCSLKSGTGAFPLFFNSIFVFSAPCCTQCTSSAVITSLAATGELLVALTALALRPLATLTTASDLMKHVNQKREKLFAKNRLVQVALGHI